MSGYPYNRSGRGGGGVRFKKRKSRFSFVEVQMLLTQVKNNRHILVGKFNRGVSSDVKKRTWASVTARINEISECPREILEIIKKWSDLKCDTKRKVAAMRASGATPARILRDLSPIEGMVHQILLMPLPDDANNLKLMANQFGDEEDEEDSLGAPAMPHPSSGMPNGRLPLHPLGMPMHPPLISGISGATLSMASKAELGIPQDMMFSRDSPHLFGDFQFEPPGIEDPGLKFDEPTQERDRISVALPAFLDPPNPEEDQFRAEPKLQVTNGSTAGSTVTPVSTMGAPSHSVPAQPPPRPASRGQGSLQEHLAHSASLSLQEQQATTVLVGALSRSLESLSESAQRLVETQQEFARDSLRMQRDTLHVLRDFSTSALALLQDKLNGHP